MSVYCTKAFGKSIKKLKNEHREDVLLDIQKTIKRLESREITSQKPNHPLIGVDAKDIHIRPDVVLLYRYDEHGLIISLELHNIVNHKKLNSDKKKIRKNLVGVADKTFNVDTMEIESLAKSMFGDENIEESITESSDERHYLFVLGDKLDEFVPDEDIRYFNKIRRILGLNDMNEIVVYPDNYGEYAPENYYTEAPVKKSKTEIDKQGTVKYSWGDIDVIKDGKTGHLYFSDESDAVVYLNMVDAINRGEFLDEGFMDNLKAAAKAAKDVVIPRVGKGLKTAAKAAGAIGKEAVKSGAKQLLKAFAGKLGLNNDEIEKKISDMLADYKKSYGQNKSENEIKSDYSKKKTSIRNLKVDDSKKIMSKEMSEDEKRRTIHEFAQNNGVKFNKEITDEIIRNGDLSKEVGKCAYLGEFNGLHWYVNNRKQGFVSKYDFTENGEGRKFWNELLDAAEGAALSELNNSSDGGTNGDNTSDVTADDDEYGETSFGYEQKAQALGINASLNRKVTGMKLNEGIERNQYEQLRADIRAIIKETLLNKGYDEDEIEEYLRIEIKDHPVEENWVKVEIRGEWNYEDSLDFMDDVNKVLQAYDPDSYMEHETANDIIAIIRKDTTEDIPDQDMVDRYADIIKGARNKEELKDIYMQIRLDDEQGILGNKGTQATIYDLVLDKFDELDESLNEALNRDITFAEWFDKVMPYTDKEFYPFDNYVKTFPSAEVLRNATASDILENAHIFYEVFFVDSADREKAFSFASEVLGLDYDVLYDAWIDEEPIKESANESLNEEGEKEKKKFTPVMRTKHL